MPPRRLEWLDQAACKDADPRLFTPHEDSGDIPDETSPRTRAIVGAGNLGNLKYAAAHALPYCQACPVVEQCLRHINPRHSGFTGIAAGVVWMQGYPVGQRPHNQRRKAKREDSAA